MSVVGIVRSVAAAAALALSLSQADASTIRVDFDLTEGGSELGALTRTGESLNDWPGEIQATFFVSGRGSSSELPSQLRVTREQDGTAKGFGVRTTGDDTAGNGDYIGYQEILYISMLTRPSKLTSMDIVVKTPGDPVMFEIFADTMSLGMFNLTADTTLVFDQSAQTDYVSSFRIVSSGIEANGFVVAGFQIAPVPVPALAPVFAGILLCGAFIARRRSAST